jgi:hypothetical protein
VILRRRSALTSWRQSGNGLLGAPGSSWRTSICATLPGAWLTGFVLFSPLHSCGSCKIVCHLLASQKDVVKCGELFAPLVHDPRVSPAHMILRPPIGCVRYQANPVVPYQTNSDPCSLFTTRRGTLLFCALLEHDVGSYAAPC